MFIVLLIFVSIWSVSLPAMVGYWFCYMQTDECRQEKLKSAERRLEEAQREAHQLLEEQ